MGRCVRFLIVWNILLGNNYETFSKILVIVQQRKKGEEYIVYIANGDSVFYIYISQIFLNVSGSIVIQ